MRERAAEVNRLQKTLEGANIKLGAVATDVLGVSARQMLAALVAGTTDPAALAELAQGQAAGQAARRWSGRCAAGSGRTSASCWPSNWRTSTSWTRPSRGQRRDRGAPAPFRGRAGAAGHHPGGGPRTAEMLVAEIGTDMSRFPTRRPPGVWAGMCPGNNESAGKRRSGRTRKGNPWLRAGLDRGRAGGRAQQRDLPGGPVPPPGGSARHEEGRGRRRPHHPGHRLPPARATGDVYHDLGGRYFDERDRDAVSAVSSAAWKRSATRSPSSRRREGGGLSIPRPYRNQYVPSRYIRYPGPSTPWVHDCDHILLCGLTSGSWVTDTPAAGRCGTIVLSSVVEAEVGGVRHGGAGGVRPAARPR